MHIIFKRFLALLHNALHPENIIAEDHFKSAAYINYMDGKEALQTDKPLTSCGDSASMISAMLIRDNFRATHVDVENKFSRLDEYPFNQDQFDKVRPLIGALFFALSPLCFNGLQHGYKGMLSTQLGFNQLMAPTLVLDLSSSSPVKSEVFSGRRSSRRKFVGAPERQTFENFLSSFLFLRVNEEFEKEWGAALEIDWPKLKENVSGVTLRESPRHLWNYGNRCFLNAPLSAFSHLLRQNMIQSCFDIDVGTFCGQFLQMILLMRTEISEIDGIHISKFKEVSNNTFSGLLLQNMHDDGKTMYRRSGKIDDYGDPVAVVETIMKHARETQFGNTFFRPTVGEFPYFAVPAQGSARKAIVCLSNLVDEANLNVAGNFLASSVCEHIILKLENFSSTGSLSLFAYLESAYLEFPFSFCKSEADVHVSIMAQDHQRVDERMASLALDSKHEGKEFGSLQIFRHCNENVIKLHEDGVIDVFPWRDYILNYGLKISLLNCGLSELQTRDIILCVPNFLQQEFVFDGSSSTPIAFGSPPKLNFDQAILVLCQVAQMYHLENKQAEDQGAAQSLLTEAVNKASSRAYKSPLLGTFRIGECYFTPMVALVQTMAHFVTYLFNEKFTMLEHVDDVNHRTRSPKSFVSNEGLHGTRMIFARRVIILSPSCPLSVTSKIEGQEGSYLDSFDKTKNK